MVFFKIGMVGVCSGDRYSKEVICPSSGKGSRAFKKLMSRGLRSPNIFLKTISDRGSKYSSIAVSLFKREQELTGIVPLCVYSTYGFNVSTWTKPINLDAMYNLLEINSQNFHFLFDFIKKQSNNFDIIINTCVSNIIELIKTKNIFINVIIVDDEIVSAYFFRKSCVQIEKNIEVLSCFASICNCDNNIFIQGFKISFWKIAADNFFGFSAIENISNNNIIINNLILKTKPLIISPTAYFFYNFAYPTFKAEKVLILN
jgi:hypothetical protein